MFSPEHKGYVGAPLHLIKCAGELAVMFVVEKVIEGSEAIDAAFPSDSTEDAEIKSKIWEQLK